MLKNSAELRALRLRNDQNNRPDIRFFFLMARSSKSNEKKSEYNEGEVRIKMQSHLLARFLLSARSFARQSDH